MRSKKYQIKVIKLVIFLLIMWFTTAMVSQISSPFNERDNNELPNKKYPKPVEKDLTAAVDDITRSTKNGDMKIEENGKEHLEIQIPRKKEGDSQKAAQLQPPKAYEGPGEMGKPVNIEVNKLSPELQSEYNTLLVQYGFNEYASRMISLRRSLPDIRCEKCKEPGRYPDDLPASSVIICFHDESWSVLLRSVHSVLDRTPDHLLQELILIDDSSVLDHLKQPLEDYLMEYPKVKLIRTAKREGLTRARIIGAEAATGEVLTFLDSHIECTEGWLEPLVAAIHEYPTAAVAPSIEVINDETFSVGRTPCALSNIGGFDWSLTFNWYSVPNRVVSKLSHPCDPIPSPTMAGGLFSIGKKFFKQIGYYDKQLDVWGGENLELSFKVWMCGGKLFQIPCSHVGHVYRKKNPYAEKSKNQFGNFVRRNLLRVAEVWLDEYKHLFYLRNGKIKESDHIGDLSEPIAKRKELGCASFDWYLKNIFPELYIPQNSPGIGELRNLGELAPPRCLDSLDFDLYKPVGIYTCHEDGGNQFWILTNQGELRNEKGCMDYSGNDDIKLTNCRGNQDSQIWIYRTQTKQIYHKATKKCLTIDESISNLKLVATQCSPVNSLSQWQMSDMNLTAILSVEKKYL